MRLLIQRVNCSKVKVFENKIVGEIKKGALVFFSSCLEDKEKDIKYLADKLVNLRIFEDKNKKMNLSLKDIEGEILIISQFTLYADTSSGRRPSFTKTASLEDAKKMYDLFVEEVKKKGLKTETGVFQAKMEVFLVNDGPASFIVDSK